MCFDLQFYTSYDNICFSPDDVQVFVSYGKDVVIFNVAEGNKVDEFKKVYNYEVGRACFSPQGQRFIGLITVFDAILTGGQSGQKLQCLYGNAMANNVFKIEFYII